MQKVVLVLLIASTLFSGCDDSFQDYEVLAVRDFYVIGTNNNASSDEAIVDPYVNNGAFDVLADISKPDLGYEMKLFVSAQESLRDAREIYELVCDDDDSFCYDPDYYAVGCKLETDLTGNCLGQTFDLNSVFSQLPFSGYVLIEVCHRVQTRCVVDSTRVLFR